MCACDARVVLFKVVVNLDDVAYDKMHHERDARLDDATPNRAHGRVHVVGIPYQDNVVAQGGNHT